MKQLFIFILVCVNMQLPAQQKKYIRVPAAYIDLGKPPYNMKPGMSAALACEQAIDSLYKTYHGGKVFLPYAYSWDRPNPSTQKGVRLRSNIIVEGVGQRLTLINNCPWFSTDFGTDSLGFEINGNLTAGMTTIPVASSAGAKKGDTVYGRFGTAAYDAGEPAVFGWFVIAGVPDAHHIRLNKSCGAAMQVAGTSSKNRRLIRVHNAVSNAVIRNLELYSNAPAEAGVYIQGGFAITVDAVRATNPGAGIAVFQFCEKCILKNSILDSCADKGNANWGRAVTLAECAGCEIRNNRFNKYQSFAIISEANNLDPIVVNNTFNNNYSNYPRVAVLSLGSGDILLDSNRFTGFQQLLFNSSQAFGKVILRNTMVDKETPFRYYEQQGIVTTGPINVGGKQFNARKTYTKKFLLPVNGTFAFDSLPKGLITAATINVDDTKGIASFYFRRDDSFTNNGADFSAQLRSGQTVQLKLGEEFRIGSGLYTDNLNYGLDKGFVVTTNTIARAGNYCTIAITYLESRDGPRNRANKSSVLSREYENKIPRH